MFSIFGGEVAKAYKQFVEDYPSYKKTLGLDKIRKIDFSRLEKQKHVYLDYTGGNLYPMSLVNKHFRLLESGVLGNPHSTNPAAQESTNLVNTSREYVLNYFNAADDYFCIFTPNASGALKIVGESYPFHDDGFFLLTLDNHNSVNGIREFAKRKGGSYAYTPLELENLYIDESALLDHLNSHEDKKNKLFAYPAQSNVTGVKHPLEYIKIAKEKGWDVLLDAAAFVPTDKLDLQKVKPDFVSVSFYKMFGYPTGLGCLLVRKDIFNKMVKPWFAGGTLTLSAANLDGYFLVDNHEKFEDGTVNYLGIPAIKFGLEYIQRLNIKRIKLRVQLLTQWLIENLSELNHDNGNALIRINGTHDLVKRGGTLSLAFYNQNGELYPFSEIEEAANKRNISIRSGCFCNPGVDETTNSISCEDLSRFFTGRESGNFYEMIDDMGKLRGSVRISVGFATNFNDVFTFYEFARGLLNK